MKHTFYFNDDKHYNLIEQIIIRIEFILWLKGKILTPTTKTYYFSLFLN